ncbi:thiamine phosphate synthase [Acetobacter conturbans]|uniref:Thiamine phosphate synthase n=1 Tax=Acetobacter conturbans TaxID=1737472 RepID=A0ABX0K1G2_9PROT|nr:thiamine phosphate synthase [Acetobacter conturbans]NHN88113.1 thiamine phosphate synthase [Acetobacter conturbans]
MTVSRLPQRIYPVVDRAFWVDRLGDAGARFVQLRIKDKSGADLLAELKEGMVFARRHGVTLVVNDFWREAMTCEAPWVHLGQEDLDTADLDALRNAGVRFGLSTHSVEELDRALATKPDYVALGPVWETRLKKMAFGPQGTAKLTEWRKRIGDLPLVAIGGVTLARAPECLAAGADCVAAVSDFILADDPAAQISAWLAATGETVPL